MLDSTASKNRAFRSIQAFGVLTSRGFVGDHPGTGRCAGPWALNQAAPATPFRSGKLILGPQ